MKENAVAPPGRRTHDEEAPMTRHLPGLLALLLAAPAAAAPPLDRVLPANTVELTAATDLMAVEAAWNHTQFGRLSQEPALQPFLNATGPEFLAQFDLPTALGWTWDDLKAMSGGEAGVAVVPLPQFRFGIVFLIDTTGRAAAVAPRLTAAADRVRHAGGTVAPGQVGRAAVTVFNFPSRPGVAHAPVGAIHKDDLLVLADPPELFGPLLAVWNADPALTLAGNAAYASIRRRTAMRPGEPEHLRWFYDPFGADRATRKPLAAGEKPKKKDPVALLRKEGFDAVQALGASAGFAAGSCDLVVRLAVQAPPPYAKGMKILSLKTGGELLPPAWTPAALSVCSVLRADAAQSFEAFAGFFDHVAADGDAGSFEDVIKGLKEDADGPKVDLRKDLVGQFGDVITVLADCAKPVNLKSARQVVVFSVKDAKTAAATVRDLFRNDPNAKRETILGREAWVVRPQPKKQKAGAPKPPPVPDAALCVDVNAGLFYVATQVGLLERVLRAAEPPLSGTADFRRVLDEWRIRAGADGCWRIFSYPAEDFRVVYEMWRSGRLEQAESIYSQTLVRLQKERAKAGLPVRFDGRKLPPFEKVGPYLGPVGLQATVRPDGWDVVGFVLPKLAGAAEPAPPAPAGR
jgi:hypothetical protein